MCVWEEGPWDPRLRPGRLALPSPPTARPPVAQRPQPARPAHLEPPVLLINGISRALLLGPGGSHTPQAQLTTQVAGWEQD